MMNKLIVICTFLVMVCNVQAETLNSGFVEKVDLDNGIVLINNVQYKIMKNKTKLLSREHQLNLNLLKNAGRVRFVLNDELVVTEIRMTTPYKFNH